jgi:prolyl 4-hydroxylase
LCEDYVNNCLNLVTEQYKKKYPYCDSCSPWKIIEDINVQYYKPNAGFYAWHTERGSPSGINASRHLVFMTYLNDVTDGGETEFFHQKLKVKPEKGLTLIWPVDWTFTHRGIPSPSEEKYITTGWFNFV